MQIIVDGLLTHYQRSGRGRSILILPGWADTSASWLPVQKALSATYDVTVLDIPGFGGSQQPSAAWGLDDYGQFVGRFVQKLGIKNLYAVIGHSNGGAMAIRALGGSHLNAGKLVLVASAGVRDVQQGRKGALRLVAKTGKALSRPLPKSVQKRLRARLYAAAGSDMLVAEHMQETFKNIVSDDVQNDAAHLRVPVLLLYGDQDTATPVRYGEMFHKLLSGSELKVLPGADHFVHVNDPDRLSQEISGFLQ